MFPPNDNGIITRKPQTPSPRVGCLALAWKIVKVPIALIIFASFILAMNGLYSRFWGKGKENRQLMRRPSNIKEYYLPGTKGGPMILVPAGDFKMGCNHWVDSECDEGLESEPGFNEEPFHRVYLDAFYIDKFEVTHGQYDECVNAGAFQAIYKSREFASEFQPVNTVKWNQARTYCEWAGKRLPTEAEWEKALRGPDGRKYPWGNPGDDEKIDCSRAVMKDVKTNKGGCGRGSTWEVGSKPAGISFYGAYDMLGNAAEWCSDFWDFHYYQTSPARNPKGPEGGYTHSLRGGDWLSEPGELRASARGYGYAESGSRAGIRCARDADLEKEREVKSDK